MLTNNNCKINDICVVKLLHVDNSNCKVNDISKVKLSISFILDIKSINSSMNTFTYRLIKLWKKYTDTGH